jgi:Holliday junction resolvase
MLSSSGCAVIRSAAPGGTRHPSAAAIVSLMIAGG